MHVPSHTPQTHLSVPPAREASRAKPEPLLSLSLHTHPKTCKLRGQIFSFSFPPSFPPQTDSKAGAGEPDARSAPAAPGDAGRPGGPGKAARAAAAGARLAARALQPSHSQARLRRPRPAARGSALTVQAFPTAPPTPRGDKRRVQPGHRLATEEEAARTPARPPPTQRGSPAQVAASARSSPPRARVLTHLQVSVRLSIGTRAAGGPAGAGQPGLDGAGRREAGSGRRAGEQRQAARGGAGRAADGGAGRERGRQPGSADPRAPLRAPRAPRARLGARRAGGGGRGGRSRRAGRGLGPRAPAGTGNALWSARPTGSV